MDEAGKKKPSSEQAHINRRLYARFPVRLPATIVGHATATEIHAEIHDISLGGALVRSPMSIKGEIRIRFTLGGVPLDFGAYVVRHADGPRALGLMYGVEFHPNAEMEQKLKGQLPPRS